MLSPVFDRERPFKCFEKYGFPVELAGGTRKITKWKINSAIDFMHNTYIFHFTNTLSHTNIGFMEMESTLKYMWFHYDKIQFQCWF